MLKYLLWHKIRRSMIKHCQDLSLVRVSKALGQRARQTLSTWHKITQNDKELFHKHALDGGLEYKMVDQQWGIWHLVVWWASLSGWMTWTKTASIQKASLEGTKHSALLVPCIHSLWQWISKYTHGGRTVLNHSHKDCFCWKRQQLLKQNHDWPQSKPWCPNS